MAQNWTVREKVALALTVAAGSATLLMHSPVGALHGGHSMHTAEHTAQTTSGCAKAGEAKTVVMTTEGIAPAEITLKACDTLAMQNQDQHEHALALASEEGHAAYPGFGEDTIQSGATRSFQLGQSGHYVLHDHHNKTFRATVHVE